MKNPAWLSQVLLESSMIVLSILLALWVNDWQQQRADERLAAQSLVNFLKEIQQNHARLDDAMPYHQGVDTALKQTLQEHGIRSRADLFQMVGLDGVRPPFLLDTAWQTALATGALTHMDYETVSALSLTYTLQTRFREDGRAGIPSALRTGEIRDDEAENTARGVTGYLDEVTDSEKELRAVYAQAEVLIRRKLRSMKVPVPDSTASAPSALQTP
jgi:hypothetical protein